MLEAAHGSYVVWALKFEMTGKWVKRTGKLVKWVETARKRV